MQPLLRRLILFLTLAGTLGIIPQKCLATHLAGSDITYTYLGGTSYRVDVTIYRDCAGVPVPNALLIRWQSISCDVDETDYINRVSGTGQEITYPCPGLVTTCDDPSSLVPGIQKWVFSGVINIQLPCFDWNISWQFCCRNCDITTIFIQQPCVSNQNPSMYISAGLDNSLPGTDNSSPYFTNSPIVFVCTGQNFTYNHGAVDPDGDSLVYSLVDPLDSATVPLVYNPGYSATRPIDDPTLTIDPATGDIVMNPTVAEVGVLSVLVEEYRDGVKIGEVVRDMEIYVKACTNNIPTATGINGTTDHDVTVCPNTQICFDIFSNDIDANDIVTMSWNQQILNATFTTSGFPHPTGRFCWTPGVNDISSIPHQFIVSVVDNACPNSGYQAYAFNILVNSPLVNINVTDISCNGLTDGSINVVPVNPGGFSYLWLNGGQTTSGISNLGAGSYPVTIYDSTTGCTATFPNTITDPPVITDSLFVITSSCTGSASGIAAAVASGGTPGYTYSWNTVPPTLNDTATGLSPGQYIVTVTDSRGCTSVDSITVNASSTALVLSITNASVLQCFTDTGSITVGVSGGTPAFTYLWNTNPVQTSPTATGLSPGNYTVSVTDSAGCSNSIDTAVTSPPAFFLQGNAVAASCNGSDGSAYLDSISGGVPGYTYSWLNFPLNTTDSLPGVPSGIYTVNITDNNGCTTSLDILVPNQTLTTTANAISNITCRDSANAIAAATVSGGTAPYTFEWNTVPPQFNDTAFGLPAGNYSVTITDVNNCLTIDTVNIPNPLLLSVSLSVVNSNCAGDSSGVLTANVSGGSNPYTYAWIPTGGNAMAEDSLIPGLYTVNITDAAGCSVSATDSVLQNTNVTITVDNVIAADCNGANTGSIDITPGGGIPPFTYLWTPGNFTSQDISNIDAGLYQVIVTDQANCTQMQQITVSEPPPVPVNAGRDTAICAGSTIQLSADPFPVGGTGTWSSNDIPDSSFSDINDNNAIVSNVPPGIVFITWTVTDANGCTSSDNIRLDNFFLNAGNDFLQCGLTSIQLNATIQSGFNGLWTASSNINFDDPTLNNATINFVTYGVDTLAWNVSGPGCFSTDYAIVAAYEMPVADAGDSSTVCAPRAGLLAVVSPPGTGMWTVRFPYQAVIADSLNPQTEATNLNNGLTVFVWTMTNGVCVDIDTVIVFYDQACELELPSGFSPNGDGFNDGYEIKGIEGYPDNFFTVFNRWGNEVYSKEDYVNTDWIGQANDGDNLPEGTYYVILRIKNSSIKKNTFVDLRRYSENK